ncbi:MAG: GAF domain-containing protein, partial [Candidatus Magnetoovum sp. WYHC-5]|nr:GAF domain-containing protein [Candidatus Magnetoovum sp. WYHC-5]
LLPELECMLELEANKKKKLLQIGTALSVEKNLDALLELIVVEAMNLTNADGGTIYLISDDERFLAFKILQNISLNYKMGGTSGTPVSFPPLNMYKPNGEKNDQMVAVHVAFTGHTVNIADVYEVDGFDFKGAKRFDQMNNYRSKSMLVTPLRNYEYEIIGVLQLINAMEVDGSIVTFPTYNQELIESLASQAAVVIDNATLIKDLDDLQMGIIQAIASAIDEKSPYTGDHIRRVTEITMMLAHGICKSNDERWMNFTMDKNEEKTLKIAAWMHDVGKIITPEHIIDKATKLEKIFDRINLVIARFEIVKRDRELRFLIERTQLNPNEISYRKLEEEYKKDIAEMNDDVDFLRCVNIGAEYINDAQLERIEQIAQKYKITINGQEDNILTENEVKNLSIRKGTLTNEERAIVENHVMSTIKMLVKLPWPKKLKNVCEYAGEHHEKIDGSGYPHKLAAEELSIQSRILAVADVFEALLAKDRPYKRGKTISEVVEILISMTKEKKLDGDILDFFIKSGLMVDYAKKELLSSQLDIFIYDGKEYDCRI